MTAAQLRSLLLNYADDAPILGRDRDGNVTDAVRVVQGLGGGLLVEGAS